MGIFCKYTKQVVIEPTMFYQLYFLCCCFLKINKKTTNLRILLWSKQKTERWFLENLTRSAVFLVRPVLAVFLPVTSPWQRDTLVGGSSAVKFLWRARLFACGARSERQDDYCSEFVVPVRQKVNQRQDTTGPDSIGLVMQLNLVQDYAARANWFYCLDASETGSGVLKHC